jgi:hypothetical protein
MGRLPVSVVTPSTPTVTFDGLTVSGGGVTAPLPNTPIV